jgi:hypothetical protein
LLKTLRRHVNSTTVIAVLALIFAMSGGALAAKRYLINSTKQLSPAVLKALKGKTGPPGANGATGAPGANGATGKEGSQGKEGPQGTPATALWAAVEPNGELNRGSGTVGTNFAGGSKGVYDVAFNRDVSKCIYEVTADNNYPSDIGASPSPKGETKVRVVAREQGAITAIEVRFYIAVFC